MKFFLHIGGSAKCFNLWPSLHYAPPYGGGLWSSDKLVENQNTTGSPINALLNSPGGRWTCWNGRRLCLSGYHDRLLWSQQRGGLVLLRIGIARSCMNLLKKNNLEVKHQAGYQNTPLPDLHSPCLIVWVGNMVLHKASVLSHWCIWHVGTTQDPVLRIPYTRRVRMWKSEQPPGHWQTFAALWTYCPQLNTRGPPPCCRCGDPGAASRLEATVRKT